MTIIILELLAAISFIYSMLLLFIAFAPQHQVFFLLLWQLFIGLIFVQVHNRSKFLEASILLLPLPLFFFNDSLGASFIVITSIYLYIYIKQSLLRGGTEQCSNNFKKTLIVSIAALFFRYWWPLMLPSGSLAHAAPFWIIYFLSSVFFVRSIRHLESGMERKKIRRANLRYLGGMSVLSVFTVWTGVIDYILSLPKRLVYWFGYAVVYLAELFLRFFASLPEFIKKGAESGGSRGNPEFSGGAEAVGETIEEQLAAWDTTILDTVITVLFMALLVFILYRMFLKTGRRDLTGQDYIEEREYIREARPRRSKRRRDKFPTSPADQIRYYYRRFLGKLAKNNLEVKNTDTSLEINAKAEAVFPEDASKIRAIYIRSRYGGKQADGETVAEMARIQKKIRH